MPDILHTINYKEATLLISQVIAYAEKDGGAPVAVAIVDIAGHLKAFASMDGVPIASRKLSRSKAYSAVVGMKDTINWASFPKNPQTVDFDMRNWTDPEFSGFTGGVLLKKSGTIIGGIGVSGRKGKMAPEDVLKQDNELAGLANTYLNEEDEQY